MLRDMLLDLGTSIDVVLGSRWTKTRSWSGVRCAGTAPHHDTELADATAWRSTTSRWSPLPRTDGPRPT